MCDKYEYTLKDMNTNFYFTKKDGGSLDEYVPLDEVISRYRKQWETTMKCVWFDFLEHCAYLIFNETHPEIEELKNHKFPSEFEPTLDMFVLMTVKRFDEEIISKDGWYLTDRVGHGYDLGLLSPLGCDWVKSFYDNVDFNLLFAEILKETKGGE